MSNYSTNFIPNKSIPFQRKKGTSLSPARVKDIILDETHPEYLKYGGGQALGAIKYELIDRTSSEEDTQELPIAYPLNNVVRVYPLINEIVLLEVATNAISSVAEKKSNPDLRLSLKNDNENESRFKLNAKKVYYTTVVGIWNNPNNNAIPEFDEKLNLGKGVEEKSVNPRKPQPGDILIEGRLGQSIRFTGYDPKRELSKNQDGNGKPLTIITNGQEETPNGFQFLSENPNKDKSSIYLTSDHQIAIKQARDKYEAVNEPPIRSDQYKGAQIIVSSGRLLFNAREEDINLVSSKLTTISSKEIGLDADDYIGLDAKKIYLGRRARELEIQPVIMGESLEVFLYQLCNNLKKLARTLESAVTPDRQPLLGVNIAGKILRADTDSLMSQINPGGQSQLKSRKVFTE